MHLKLFSLGKVDQNADYLKNELRVPTPYIPAHDGCLWCSMSIGVLCMLLE